QKEGCILFLDKSLKDSEGNVLTTYNSLATYKKSKEVNDRLITPVSCESEGEIDCEDPNNKNTDYCKYCYPYGQTSNDTNLILKVQRDRICGQWLSCISSHSVWDKQLGKYEEVCDAYMRCDKLTGSGSGARCTHFINEPDEILDEKKYKERDISWSGMDYSGLSISNMLPVEKMEPILTNSTYGIYDLAIDGLCYSEEGTTNNQKCCSNNDCPSRYHCYKAGTTESPTCISKTVRAYPEAESPYQDSVKEYYSNVNTCITGEGGDQNYQNCQGWYTKATYGNTYTFYYQKGITPPDAVYTDTGEKADSCNVASGSTIGTDPNNRPCALLTKTTEAIGLRGFCLEPDKTKPDDINACITWWPGSATGDIDVNQYYTSAGYIPTRRYYGVEKKEAFNLYNSDDIGTDKVGEIEYSGKSGDCGNSCPGVDNNNAQYFCFDIDDRDNPTCKNNKEEGSLTINLPYKGTTVYKSEIKEIDFNVYSDDKWCGIGDRSGWDEMKNGKWLHGDDESKDFEASWADGDDWLKINPQFDDEGKLESFKFNACDGSPDDGGFGLHKIKIVIKPGAKKILEIFDNPAIAYTNRVNNVNGSGKNFYGDTEKIDGKTIDSPCSPWGAIGGVNFVSGKPYYVYEKEGCGVGTIDSDSIYSSENKIYENLFAKYNRYYNLSSDTLKYESGPNTVDKTQNYHQGPPYVASVTCDESGECNIKNLNKITIGKTDSGTISVKAPYTAVLKFYAWANKDQMPIREIAVDWGDGTIQQYSGLMAKNHKPKCCESNNSCNNISAGSNETVYDSAGDATPYLNFGNVPDACTPKYFLLAHTYTEPGTYTPKVYIKDNWGWCNGNNAYAGDNSCLDPDNDPSTPTPSNFGTSGPKIEVSK
ncbi:hypothetical protein J7K86_00400, partial [bacterium]|nr:hypothetical protein [bacterium]